MKRNRVLTLLVVALCTIPAFGQRLSPVYSDMPSIPAGPFSPDYESLKNYKCPDWYQDAKFGIWAHWGPQGVPMQGDWYARNMYVEGHRNYKYHLETYGHLAEFGFKDVIGLWKAEKFNPDYLIGLYKAAGAKYFVSMACHHDNFDLWDSKYHRWNAVEMGPKKDIVGMWQAATLKHGLKFGISEHMAVVYKWYSVSHGSDKEGRYAGLPYDGAKFENFDLYGPTPEKVWQPGGELWSEDNIPDHWKKEWYMRMRDIIDNYKPDYVYSDYGNVPFRRDVGWKFLAAYYNDNIARNGGNLECVYTGKGDTERVYTRDYENSRSNDIQPEPWQMDKCIMNFYYDVNLKPIPVIDVVTMLIDVVSKNGNLLLSIPQKPDGTLDAATEKLLGDMAGWMNVNEEAIFSSRPFKIYGETGSQTPIPNRRGTISYTSEDIRFTVKNDTLYVFTLGVPQKEVRIKSLSTNSPYYKGKVEKVELLGYAGKLSWKSDKSGMTIQIPEMKELDMTAVFRITGLKELQWDGMIYADMAGQYTLGAVTAKRMGAHYDVIPERDIVHTANWSSPVGYISWDMNVTRPGMYEVLVKGNAVGRRSTGIAVETDDKTIMASFPPTSGSEKYQTISIGKIKLSEKGKVKLKLRAIDPATWNTFDFVSVVLKPTK